MILVSRPAELRCRVNEIVSFGSREPSLSPGTTNSKLFRNLFARAERKIEMQRRCVSHLALSFRAIDVQRTIETGHQVYRYTVFSYFCRNQIGDIFERSRNIIARKRKLSHGWKNRESFSRYPCLLPVRVRMKHGLKK